MLSQLLVREVAAPVYQRLRREYDARRAEAALYRGLLHKGLLQWREAAVRVRQAVHGEDVLPVRPGGEVDAGVVRLPVDEHRAGPALAHVAAALDRGEREVVPQEVGQRGADVQKNEL